MRPLLIAAILVWLSNAAGSSAFCQLRNASEYSQDRINTEKTYFVFRDTGAAEYGWVSEWTMYTSIDYEGKPVMLLWHFKDGSTAYALQAEDIGETGRGISYCITGKSSNLEDVRRKPVQPMNRQNYPVKLELWIGEFGETGFTPKVLMDTVCFDQQSIEPNRTYNFSSCKSVDSKSLLPK
jgi:hypothetical protein